MTEQNREKEVLWRAYGRYSGAGVQLVVTTMAGVFLGRYADTSLATRPLFLVIGGVLGMLVGFYTVYRLLNFFNKKDERGD